MARALIGGLIGRGTAASQLSVGEPVAPARAKQLARDFKVRVSADNRAAIDGCDLVIVAVKPQEAGAVLKALAPAAASAREPCCVSVAAGIQIASLSAWVGAGVPVIRTMPNRPALIGAGVTGMYRSARGDHGAAQRWPNRPCRPRDRPCGWRANPTWTWSRRCRAADPPTSFCWRN